MARIAEDLLLLLLDNASARPALDELPRHRVLSGAILLDLAHTCRIRPSDTGDSLDPGRLLVRQGCESEDPAVIPALQMLSRKPLTPADAIAKLRRGIEPHLLEHLTRSGCIQRIELPRTGFRRRRYVWILTDRNRPAAVRAAMLSTLLDDRPPAPSTAAIISLLYSIDGLPALLSLDERGRQWVNSRAGEIASGIWVNEFLGQPPEVNLAVTTALIRTALR